jgi:hypothetical protein
MAFYSVAVAHIPRHATPRNLLRAQNYKSTLAPLEPILTSGQRGGKKGTRENVSCCSCKTVRREEKPFAAFENVHANCHLSSKTLQAITHQSISPALCMHAPSDVCIHVHFLHVILLLLLLTVLMGGLREPYTGESLLCVSFFSFPPASLVICHVRSSGLRWLSSCPATRAWAVTACLTDRAICGKSLEEKPMNKRGKTAPARLSLHAIPIRLRSWAGGRWTATAMMLMRLSLFSQFIRGL